MNTGQLVRINDLGNFDAHGLIGKVLFSPLPPQVNVEFADGTVSSFHRLCLTPAGPNEVPFFSPSNNPAPLTDIPNPSTLNPAWTDADRDEAIAAGWDIFTCHGSSHGPFQVQKLDKNEGVEGCPQTDDEVCDEIRKNPEFPLHQRALAFLRAHNPREWLFITTEIVSPPACT